MHKPTHQTVRLARGKHQHPGDGVCVMELASMLAHEPFTDHPMSVCPVIGAVLRAYNDGIGDERRQDLYEFASLAVGTRGSEAVRNLRLELCRQWVAGDRPRGVRRFLPFRPLLADGTDSPDAVGAAVARVAAKRAKSDPAAHAALLQLVASLVALGADSPASAEGVVSQRTPPASMAR
jgi:hypothetical protein